MSHYQPLSDHPVPLTRPSHSLFHSPNIPIHLARDATPVQNGTPSKHHLPYPSQPHMLSTSQGILPQKRTGKTCLCSPGTPA